MPKVNSGSPRNCVLTRNSPSGGRSDTTAIAAAPASPYASALKDGFQKILPRGRTNAQD